MTEKEKNKEYDIFVSYRRDDGGQYARILQLELERYGYKVFLDYEELTDGVFGDEIVKAIQSAPIFIMVLTPLYLARSMEPDSWIAKEIQLAIDAGKHFIPVDPDRKFNGIPEGTPDAIADIVAKHQHSSIDFGQALKATVDLMVQNRIIPHVPLPKPSRRKWLVAAAVAIGLACVGVAAVAVHRHRVKAETERLKAQCEALAEGIQNYLGQYVNWASNISVGQLRAVASILDAMVEVEGGTFMQGAAPSTDGTYDDLVCPELETPQAEQTVEPFFIGKYEVSVAEWCGVMGLAFDESEAHMPIADVSFRECERFAMRLGDLTGLGFNVPTESEWEYAARGGADPDGTWFAGSDRPDEVAWYHANAGGKAHVRNDNKGGLDCNRLDLFDMSGNVCEWCSTPFSPYDPTQANPDPDAMVIRGGYYDSEPYELTVFHRDPMNPAQQLPNVGFRLVIDNRQK